jgi:hypothetical protein
MWNGPSLWERGTRNEESVILKKGATRKLQCKHYKETDKASKDGKRYRRQGMIRVACS